MTILKTNGHQFPELKEADAMFTSDTAPSWSDGDVCHRCRVEFSFTVRKHHCRNWSVNKFELSDMFVLKIVTF